MVSQQSDKTSARKHLSPVPYLPLSSSSSSYSAHSGSNTTNIAPPNSSANITTTDPRGTTDRRITSLQASPALSTSSLPSLSSNSSSPSTYQGHTHIPLKGIVSSPRRQQNINTQLHGILLKDMSSSLESSSYSKKPTSPSLLKQSLRSSPGHSGSSTPLGTSPGNSNPSSPGLRSRNSFSSKLNPSGRSTSDVGVVKETHEISIDYDPVSGRKVLNSYEIIKELGRGQHGKVKLARDIEHGDYVAIKVVDRNGRPHLGRSARPGNTQEDIVRREIAILKKCFHPNIVQLLEVLDDVNSRKIYLVLEYLEKGEVIWQNEDGSPALSRDLAKSTARDVLLGLEYLHFQGIIHRDIKPANLLLSKDGKVKISDFGVSYATSLNYENNELELAKTAGTPAFFAPELCVSSSSDDPARVRLPITNKIDIWAFGVTLYCFLYGCVPFTADSEYELFKVIVDQPLVFPDEADDTLVNDDNDIYDTTLKNNDKPRITEPKKVKRKKKLSKETQNSIFYNLRDDSSMFASDSSFNDSAPHSPAVQSPTVEGLNNPMSRITLTESAAYVNPDYFPSPRALAVDADLELAKDLIKKLLEKDPLKRIDIAEIKRHPWISDGMTAPNLEDFLHLADNDKQIEVTEKEMKVAVRGITGKIKRGLTKFGNSALEFTGLRRKQSQASIYTFMTSSNTPSRTNSPDSSNGTFRRPRLSTTSNSHSNAFLHRDKSGSFVTNSAASSYSSGPAEDDIRHESGKTSHFSSSVSSQPPTERSIPKSQTIPASSSNINLNALLAGESSLKAIDPETHNVYSTIPSVAITDSSTSDSVLSPDGEQKASRSRVKYSMGNSVLASGSDESEEEGEEEDDDDGELTLVLGPHRQFPSMSVKKDTGGLRKAPSISSLQDKGKFDAQYGSSKDPQRLRPGSARDSLDSTKQNLRASLDSTKQNLREGDGTRDSLDSNKSAKRIGGTWDSLSSAKQSLMESLQNDKSTGGIMSVLPETKASGGSIRGRRQAQTSTSSGSIAGRYRSSSVTVAILQRHHQEDD